MEPNLTETAEVSGAGGAGYPKEVVMGTERGSVTLHRAVRATTWRRLAIAAFAVPAILFGLLAMHAFAAGSIAADDHAGVVVTTDSATSAVTQDPIVMQDAIGGHCDSSCTPHGIDSMACVLAILTILLGMALAAAAFGWFDIRALLMGRQHLPRAIAPPRPLSLDVLSISRI